MSFLDALTGAPNLDALGSLGVDPNQIAAVKQIQGNAQQAAILPGLFSGVLSALAGQRRGAGTRFLEGMGRGYSNAEQSAMQEPLQMAALAAKQRMEALKS